MAVLYGLLVPGRRPSRIAGKMFWVEPDIQDGQKALSVVVSLERIIDTTQKMQVVEESTRRQPLLV